MALLGELPQAEDVSRWVYLEALLRYASSCYKQPGSWEANRPFDFLGYDDRLEEGRYADRWF